MVCRNVLVCRNLWCAVKCGVMPGVVWNGVMESGGVMWDSVCAVAWNVDIVWYDVE